MATFEDDWKGSGRWSVIEVISTKVPSTVMIKGDTLTFLGKAGEDLQIDHGGSVGTLGTGCTYDSAEDAMKLKHVGLGDRMIYRDTSYSPVRIECHPIPGGPPTGGAWTAEDQG